MTEQELLHLLAQNTEAAVDRILLLQANVATPLPTMREIRVRLTSALAAATSLESLWSGNPHPKE